MTRSEPVRISALLGRSVDDVRGERVGDVIDVRLVQDGPAHPGAVARLRVAGLIVSARRSGRLLGYERTPKEGPWLIRVLVQAYAKGVRYVPWRQVAAWDGGKVRLTVAADTLSDSAPLPHERP